MYFNSYEFLLIFLPTSLILFYVVKRFNSHLTNYIFALISLVFYSFFGFKSLIFLISCISFNYLFSIILCRFHKKWTLITAIGINLSILAYYKYTNFAGDILNIGLRIVDKEVITIPKIIAPVGISFIVFQNIAYLVDVYNDEQYKMSFEKYLIFSLMFQHLLQGPILYRSNMGEEIIEKGCNYNKISEGIIIFTIGLAKKLLLADVFGNVVNCAYSDLESLNLLTAIYVSFCYTLQLYFDFSGYSDMAIGIGRFFQIELPINFDSPYKAASISEFWNKWHITLTRFFTKYLYIPLGGNRKGRIHTVINILIVFGISGLWHGASFAFIAWGLLHGFAMVVDRNLTVLQKIPQTIKRIFTFLFVNFAWILFRSASFSVFRQYMKAFRNIGWSINEDIIGNISDSFFFQINTTWAPVVPYIYLMIGLCIVFLLPNANEVIKKAKYNNITSILIIITLLICLMSMGGVTTFIYEGF